MEMQRQKKDILITQVNEVVNHASKLPGTRFIRISIVITDLMCTKCCKSCIYITWNAFQTHLNCNDQLNVHSNFCIPVTVFRRTCGVLSQRGQANISGGGGIIPRYKNSDNSLTSG